MTYFGNRAGSYEAKMSSFSAVVVMVEESLRVDDSPIITNPYQIAQIQYFQQIPSRTSTVHVRYGIRRRETINVT